MIATNSKFIIIWNVIFILAIFLSDNINSKHSSFQLIWIDLETNQIIHNLKILMCDNNSDHTLLIDFLSSLTMHNSKFNNQLSGSLIYTYLLLANQDNLWPEFFCFLLSHRVEAPAWNFQWNNTRALRHRPECRLCKIGQENGQ